MKHKLTRDEASRIGLPAGTIVELTKPFKWMGKAATVEVRYQGKRVAGRFCTDAPASRLLRIRR